MNKSKSNIGKSKSSNATIPTKDEYDKNKKSLSNSEFQPKVLKKRGVYVERKLTKTNLNIKVKRPVDGVIKPQLKKRPGKKKFLSSVLTILSKSTAGTQCDIKPDKLDKAKRKLRKGNKDDKIVTETSILKDDYTTYRKYKSKVLNNRSNETDQLVVLRSKKDIVHTPSNYSDKSNVEIKWTNFPRFARAGFDEDIQKEYVDDGVDKIMVKKVTIESEPTTLVSDKPKDKLYNLFVDLLETTLSVYNVNTGFTKPAIVSSSNIALQIDDSVAKKLEVKKQLENISEKPSKHFINDKYEENWNVDDLLERIDEKPLSVKLSEELPIKIRKKRRRTKSDKKQVLNTQGGFVPSKKSDRKHMKRNLLSLFKKQLKMNVDCFEEPESFYKSLKTIARNKRKSQNSIQFDHVTNYDGPTGCRFNRQNIYSTYKKSNKKYKVDEFEKSITSKISIDNIDYLTNMNNIPEYRTDFNESRHSLKVYGLDLVHAREKDIIFSYVPSPSISDNETKCITWNCDSKEAVWNADT